MPSKSEKQRKFFELVKSVQKGEKSPNDVSPEVRKVANSISQKDAEDFSKSIVELKLKKAVLSIIKDIREPMYLNEDGEENISIDPISTTFHVKKNWSIYIKSFIGQPFLPKEIQSISNLKEKKPTTVNRTEIWYKTTDDFNINKTTVIKKMKDAGQFSFNAFQKHQKIKDIDNNTDKNVDSIDKNTSNDSISTNVNTTIQPSNNNMDDIIITKSILFKDEIKGASILIEFLKKLEL